MPEEYQWRTPFDQVNKIQAPVLLIHGEKDQNVSIQHSYLLEEKLKQLHKPVETWYYSTFTHYFPPKENRRIVRQLTQWMKTADSEICYDKEKRERKGISLWECLLNLIH